MPSGKANYIINPNWETARKVQSRADTIIGPYRAIFGHALPPNGQYWSMCGAHYHLSEDNNEPSIIDGELMQLVHSGIIQPSQFIGVDRNKKIIENNRKVYPKVNWINGDFKNTMSSVASKGQFYPAVINYDGVMGPKFGAAYLKSIMQLLDHNSEDVMLVGNFVLRNPYCNAEQWDGLSVINNLLKSYTPPDHWHLLPHYYTYKGGSGTRSRTTMGSFVLAKKGTNNARTAGRRLDDLVIS